MSSHRTPGRLDLLILVLATGIFAAQGARLGEWIIDDAGITYAYARNLVEGYGLVAQPGLEAVEGYSNFLWLVLLLPFFALDVFHPVWVPKALGLVLVFGTLALMLDLLGRLGVKRLGLRAACLGVLALCASFVIWTLSGLENALTAFLVTLSTWATARALSEDGERRFTAVAALAAAGAALCRPDGMVYLAAPPAALVAHAASRHLSVREWVARLGLHFGLTLPVVSAFLVFRRVYFGDWVPNTFRAKVGSVPHLGPRAGLVLGAAVLLLLAVGGPLALSTPWRSRVRQGAGRVAAWLRAPRGPARAVLPVIALTLLVCAAAYAFWPSERFMSQKPYQLGYAVAGRLGPLLLAGVLVGLVRTLFTRPGQPALVAVAVHLVFATAVQFILPRDWMGEVRFATAALPLLLLAATALIAEAAQQPGFRWLAGAPVAALAVLAAGHHLRRVEAFARAPTVPFAEVAHANGTQLGALAEQLGVQGASALLPDIGGALYASRMRVHDLAGLCDRTFAQLQRAPGEQLREHILVRVRPTFIRVHSVWTLKLGLDLDPRFTRDYVPLEAWEEPLAAARGEVLRSGLFVRREVAEAAPEAFTRLRR